MMRAQRGQLTGPGGSGRWNRLSPCNKISREENSKKSCERPRENGTARSFCAVSGWYSHFLIQFLAAWSLSPASSHKLVATRLPMRCNGRVVRGRQTQLRPSLQELHDLGTGHNSLQ